MRNTVRTVLLGQQKLLLDKFPGALAAYSLRKLSSKYKGACIRVRRSSDNAEQDIGFVRNYLDITSLLSFVGASNGFVTTWYNQAGGENLTNTTSTGQPRIVNAGVVGSDITFDGSDDSLATSAITNAANASIATVFSTADTTWMLFTNGIATTTPWLLISQSGNTGLPYSGNGTPTFRKNGALLSSPTRADIFTNFATGSRVQSTIESINCASYTNFGVSGYTLSAFGLNGTVSEVIIYPTPLPSRQGIESNQISYYGIT